ncbi:hypothetical protein [Streptomyces qinglanensis]|uniref:Uncharacterized protein n=1 Tax=Streptomyces qinglanensis TaxID=943816 RepID=A0A1H9U574_9ACTN|nr:hypothetical protein [Streptomyces qinglanensis]SES04388.1 hypothetical protein SAMN05421870_107328 [Streptomyces qinglanensis]
MTTIAPSAVPRSALGAEARRHFLLAIARRTGTPFLTTGLALQIYATTPWHTTARSTARRDLRDLARRAYLVPHDTKAGRVYQLGSDPNPAHPVRHVRRYLLEVIRREGGEWTVGRLKPAWRQVTGTHVLRMSCRRYLADLYRDGHLDRHGEGTPRRFYTLPDHTTGGAA